MVNMDNLSSQPGVLPAISPATYTLEEVEVEVFYDEENYAIIDKTEHVQVNLKGPQSVLTLFQVMRPTYEIFVDVTEREEGVHTLNVQHRGFPSELTVSVVPQFVRVELQEKQTVSLPVQVDLINSSEVEEGYTVGTPIVTPVNVDVTAARSLVSEVASAKAFVDVAGVDKMVEEAVPIKLYDESGQELFLPVNPAVVDVRVPVTSPNRAVPTKVTRTGELEAGLSIQEVKIEPAEVTIYGPTEIVERMNVIEVGELNLSELTESGTYEMTVPVPPGVERVSPETVNVTVTVAAEDTQEMTNVPVEVMGARDGQIVTFAGANKKEMTLIAKGTAALLAKLSLADIQAFVDVSDLPEGDHTVDVQINGPANIRFSSNERTIPITIRNDVFEGENE